MQIKCVVTGKRFAYNNFPNSNSLYGLHPILSLPKKELLKIATQAAELNAEDSALLLLAFLSKLVSVQIVPPLSLDSIGTQFANANLPLLITACQASPSRLQELPQLRLSQDALDDGGLIGWLELLQEGLKYGSILRTEEEEENLGNGREYAKAINASRKRNLSSFKMVWAWALDSMLLRCPEFKENGFRTLSAILNNGTVTSLDYMQDLKGRMLEHLPEQNPDLAFRKSIAIERVDACIAEALKISITLGLHTSQQVQDMAQTIASTYTIEGIADSAKAPTKVLKDIATLLEGQAQAQAKAATIPKKQYSMAQITANAMLQKLYDAGKITAS